LRKTLIAALTALTALALAAVAIAQTPPSIDVTATVSPSKAGTKKKPKSEKLNLNIVNNKESKTSASKIEISIPKSLKLSTKGLKTCSVSKLDSQGKASCPKGSLAGIGTADALVNPSSATPAPLKFNVSTFVAGKNLLAFYLEQQGIGCPKTREHPIGVKITYVPNPNPPAASSASSVDGAPCSGKAP
jgi:hypothetical protein